MHENYDSSSIQVLENRDAVRQRPGMYIGDTGTQGYHHLVWEVVDNAVDEAMNGYASVIKVRLHKDGRTLTVADDGRGIPVDIHPEKGVSSLEVVFSVLHSGGKFQGQNAYKSAGGLHGVGASVVNFLSESLFVTVWRDGIEHQQRYKQGVPQGPVKETGSCKSSQTGTRVEFRPDPEIFGPKQVFDAALIRERLEVKTYLNRGLRIVFTDESAGESQTFQHDEGVKEYLDHIIKADKVAPVHTDPILIEEELPSEGVRLNLAFQWTEDTASDVRSYVNTIPTPGGGTHENGYKAGLTKALRLYFDVNDSIPKSLDVSVEDLREGLRAVVSVFVEGEVQFQSQVKSRFNDSAIQSVVTGAVRNHLEQYLLNNRSVAESITNRIVQAAKARAASRSASKTVRRKKPVQKKLTLPGKLADCSSNNANECEIFIVEGDSAGGNAKQARDRRTQAVLPLRGKVLNTESASTKRVLKNKEISDIIEALGCGLLDKYNPDRLRYHRVILLMDADSDGHHITALMLTFFYRYMPQLVLDGHLFIAQPPLYKIKVGQEIHWALDDEEKASVLDGLGSRAEKADISRFKGLGEMQKSTLKDTALDPEQRHLLRVEVPAEYADETDETIKDLLGKGSQARYDFIIANYDKIDDLDI